MDVGIGLGPIQCLSGQGTDDNAAPLTLTQSTLWPPMAWAIMSGLVASTLLTLVVIPALYHVLFASQASGHAATA